jgi:hypothetical protein
MALQSLWFRNNSRLRQCLVSDPHHVKLGDQGFHVLLIQQGLSMLDSAFIDPQELNSCYYGKSTASAVKQYKTFRKIINYSYQTSADDIVGKMTIQSLDDGMAAKERQYYLLFAGAIPVPLAPKGVVISEVNPPWFKWAQQVRDADPVHRDMVTMNNGARPKDAASRIKDAIASAGGGAVVFSVGHARGAGTQDDGGQTLYDNEG